MPTQPHMADTFAMVVGHTLFQGFRKFSPTEAWVPSVNVYELRDRVEVAVDLAGIHRDHIDVRVEPGRLIIRGVRQAPEPPECAANPEGCQGQPMRIVTMEIDYGPFSRSIAIPDRIDLAKVCSEYREGILWISLPLSQERSRKSRTSDSTRTGSRDQHPPHTRP